MGLRSDRQRSLTRSAQEMARWQRSERSRHRTCVRVPLGVIGIIYESRPNVTADAGALCLKAGNAAILRCGSESFHSSHAILNAALQTGLSEAGLPEGCNPTGADHRSGRRRHDADHGRHRSMSSCRVAGAR